MTPTVDRDTVVALMKGRVLNAATGGPLAGRFTVRNSLDLKTKTMPLRIFSDGTFVFSGNKEEWFPLLDEGDYQISLTIKVNAAEFWDDEVLVEVAHTISQGTEFSEPFDFEDVMLTPDPVNIRGRVSYARQKNPIEEALVTVASEWGTRTEMTDEEGRYRFNNVAVGPSARIRVSAPGVQSQERVLQINYRDRINVVTFRLLPPPA